MKGEQHPTENCLRGRGEGSVRGVTQAPDYSSPLYPCKNKANLLHECKLGYHKTSKTIVLSLSCRWAMRPVVDDEIGC